MTGMRAWARVSLTIALAARPALAQVEVACGAGAPRDASTAALLHPDRVVDRYGENIAAREWIKVLRAVQQDVRVTFDSVRRASPTAPFVVLDTAFQNALGTVLDQLPPLLDADLSRRAALLQNPAFRQFAPFPDMGGGLRILQVDSSVRPIGIVVAETMKPDEYEAICWAGRSVSQLLGGVNFETVPLGMARINALGRSWERYRFHGPNQLIHELVVNRLLRRVLSPGGDARFEPPRLDLVVLHPFAGVELSRVDGSIRENESLAIETGGVTIWFGQWKHFVGASWILAYDADGRIGRGPLLRLSTLATAGVLSRKDAGGTQRRSLLLTVDLLRVLKWDDLSHAVQQTRSIAGKLLDSPLRSAAGR
jgi:hypothetical protein